MPTLTLTDSILVARIAARVAGKLLLWLSAPPATAANSAEKEHPWRTARTTDTVRDVMQPGQRPFQKTVEQQFAETMDVWPSMMGTMLDLMRKTEDAGFPRAVARAIVLSQLGIHTQVTLADLDFPLGGQ